MASMNLKKTTAPWVQTAISTALLIGAVSADVQAAGIGTGVNLPNRSLYGMTSDQSIYVLKPGASQFVRLGRADVSDGGNLIGIDFRPADATPTRMYGLTDRGNLYTIDVSANNLLKTTLVSTMNPRFTGGFGNIMDFNPVVNALRVSGTNDQNLAVVNGATGGNLATTVAQTTFAYVTGDVNFGKDPELIGGAYTNNFAGATTTLFFMIDHDKDTFVTIADKTATGSSNTGGGKLQTIGTVVDQYGVAMNFSPTTDIDVYTDANGINYLVGQSTRWLFSIDLTQINPTLAVGKSQKVVAYRGNAAPLPGSGAPLTGGFFDIAIPPR
jgi:hypothetical protein